jgi:hypothetical protein
MAKGLEGISNKEVTKTIQFEDPTRFKKKKPLMEQHCVPHQFHGGDRVWLHLERCQFQHKAYSY